MAKYQDQNTLKIPVAEEDRRSFAWEGWDGFHVVDEQEGESYKDSAPTITILHRTSDDTYWSFLWYKHTSHYGYGEHMYDVDPYLYQVKQVVKTVEIKTWPRVTN